MPAVVGTQFRRHRLQLASEKHVEKQGLHDVIGVMAQSDLGKALFRRKGVKRSPAQPGAKTAHGFSVRNHPGHDAVGVLLQHVVGHAQGIQIRG